MGLANLAASRRFDPEREAREMQTRSGDVLRGGLAAEKVRKLQEFGDGKIQPILTVSGFLPLSNLPPTPVSGFCDDRLVAEGDLLLLGIYDLMGVEPVAYTFENAGRLFRNVVPAAAGQLSSHGYDRELPFHIDNPCGWFEGIEDSIAEMNGLIRSPIPRLLGFVGLRNQDAAGLPVATEDLPFEPVLAQLSPEVIAALERPEYQIDPPSSNDTTALANVPVLVRSGDKTFVRFASGGMTASTPEGAAALSVLSNVLEASAHLAEAISVEPGMIHVFDNYRVAHRRPKFEPGDLRTARWLRRCYAAKSVTNGRRLDQVNRPNEWA